MARERRKVIVTCAITGAIHTPSMSPHLPVTPKEITESAIAAAKAGAAILHLHARDPETGKPDQSADGFASLLAPIAERCDAVLNMTTGGSPFMTVDERAGPAAHWKPELASLNMGSMNFGLYPMLNRYSEFQHDWERPFLEGSRDLVFRNSFQDIEYVLSACAAHGTRFEFECYDISHLYTLAHFLDRGLVEGPLFIQSVFGLLGGIGTHGEDVLHMRRTADRLFGDAYQWSVLGAGAAQMRIGAQSLSLGGHMRVGLEDSLWAGPGQMSVSNAEQVTAARELVESLGAELATPDEARAMLALKGASNVGF